jgi:hypothetical protein
VKRVALLLLPLSAACASLSGGGGGAGAESPNAAIQQFLAAARAKNLSAMANIWGTDKGPAGKSLPRQELERRELIMIQCLAHEQATPGTPAPGEAGRLRIPVELSLLTLRARPTFSVVKGPDGRWFVEDLELAVLRDGGFCGAAAALPAPPNTGR